MNNIILTGGGTAGHITPNIALLPYLNEKFDNVYYVGSENGMERSIADKNGLPFYSVPCAKLVRKFTLKNLAIPFTLFKGVKKAGKLIDELKPNVIFSKGGYVGLPTVIAAKKRGIPVIAHESDYSVGLANKISAKFCKTVLTSFPETALTVKNGKAVGSPIRRELFSVTRRDGLNYFGLSGDRPVLLVTGGSLGAKAINDVLRKSVEELLKTFDIIHICGKGNLGKRKLKGYIQTEFTDKMEYAFACADICVSRAGANTVFEIASLKIPALLIPLPKTVSRGDQILNAEYFKNLGLAEVLYQEDLTPKTLVTAVNRLYADKNSIAQNFRYHPVENAAPTIAKILAESSLSTT